MILTKEFLQEEYWDKWKLIQQIADENKTTRSKITTLMDRYEIPRRGQKFSHLPKEAYTPAGTKWCGNCKRILSITEFHKAGKKAFSSFCKECRSLLAKLDAPEDNRKKWIKKAELVIEFGNKCAICGTENLPIVCYSFHHKNPGEKQISISTSLYDSYKKAFNEVREKCIMICNNCHNIEHYGNKTALDILNENNVNVSEIENKINDTFKG